MFIIALRKSQYNQICFSQLCRSRSIFRNVYLLCRSRSIIDMHIAALQKLLYNVIRFSLLYGNCSIIRSAFRSSAEVAVYSEMHIPALRKIAV